jgi:prepilin-type N-terminal cleavage/methylation domain-containing protein
LNGLAGFTLTEILVTVVVIAMGCLGALWMQSVAMRGHAQSEHLTVASSLAESEIERLRSLPFAELTSEVEDHESSPACLILNRLGERLPGNCSPSGGPASKTYWRKVEYFKRQPTNLSHQVQVTVEWRDAHGPHQVVYTAALTSFNLSPD